MKRSLLLVLPFLLSGVMLAHAVSNQTFDPSVSQAPPLPEKNVVVECGYVIEIGEYEDIRWVNHLVPLSRFLALANPTKMEACPEYGGTKFIRLYAAGAYFEGDTPNDQIFNP